MGGCCLIVGDKLFFYYSGRAGSGRLGKEKSFWDADGATGLAFLRRDGFASLDAGDEDGVLTTRPVEFTGGHLFVNADLKGELRAEVLNPNGEMIPPFSRDNCNPVSGDKTLLSVTWKGAGDLSAVSGKPVRFRFYIRKGSLFSFWVSPDTSGASHGYVAAGGPGFTGTTDTVGMGR